MSRSINIGNGSVLVGLDSFGQVKDFYYHYAGLENHVSENLTHKIGIYVDNSFSWVDDGTWEIKVFSEEGTMASDIPMINKSLGIEMHFNDVIYNEKNIFIREVVIKNLYDRKRDLKLFFNQQFNISQTHTGDTAYYDPRERVLIHYKGRRVFLINAFSEEGEFSEYSVGLLGIEGKAGTFKDAEDGKLSGNAIEHGQVDSVLALGFQIPAREEKKAYYFISAAKSLDKAKEINENIVVRHPLNVIKSTKDYWRAWVNVKNFSFYALEKPAVELFKKSLLYIRTHVSKNGSIIASSDSSMLQFGRDTYSYVWPRDGAFAALALAQAGDVNASHRFFRFCCETLTEEGYFMHKYRPDRALGSSWHPWVREGVKQFPIQEDETALVIFALWKHYELSRDIEFIEEIYNCLIKKSAEFMLSYLDEKTGLPRASYDIWEQNYGIYTFTASSVYASLKAASKFANLLGKTESETKYKIVADNIKKSILKYLYNQKEGIFYKSIDTSKKELIIDKTVDISSVYGIFKFGILESGNDNLEKAIVKAVEKLEVKTNIGGIARYEGDIYLHQGGNYPGNPWIITSMWLAQYYISQAKTESDMEIVRRWISWVVRCANPAGILPEQVNPFTGEHLSASPLVWSHAEYVTTIICYLEKLEELGICKACYPIS